MATAGQYHTADITLNVNGQAHSLQVRHHWTLLDVIREQLDLTGSKKGCDRGECGSCTVLLDGKPVYACQLLAVQVGGRPVVTIEGLGDGTPGPERMDPVQRAFLEEDGGQCGFCTPGLCNVHPRPAERQSQSHRRRNPASPRRQPLPLQRLRPHPGIGAGRPAGIAKRAETLSSPLATDSLTLQSLSHIRLGKPSRYYADGNGSPGFRFPALSRGYIVPSDVYPVICTRPK